LTKVCFLYRTPLLKYIGKRIITSFANFFTGEMLTDIESGYKMFKGGVIDLIRFEPDDFRIKVKLVIKRVKI
jgi:hypothetical protein